MSCCLVPASNSLHCTIYTVLGENSIFYTTQCKKLLLEWLTMSDGIDLPDWFLLIP